MQFASAEKLRGGFYTPEPMAEFILRWAVNGNKKLDILEPSCGDGRFLKQIKASNLDYNSITAVEIDPHEARKSDEVNLPRARILNEDFFTFYNNTDERYDIIIGNPPYIRYQYFNKDQRREAEKIFTN